MQMTLHRASRYALVVTILAWPAAAGAQAFGLNEIGSCALARGFAVTGAPCNDASSIYWNPGAVPKARGLSVLGGVAIIKINGDFTRDTTLTRYEADVPTEFVPHLFLNYRGAGKLAYGVGVYVPYGLTSQWPDNFPGRFSAKRASLRTIYIQPNLSYQLTDNWSIGGGPVIGHSTVELVQALDLSSQALAPGVTFGSLGVAKYTEFGRVNLKGSAMAYGFNLGVHGQINKDFQVGLRLLSQLSFNYNDADATFTQTLTGIVIPATIPGVFPAGTRLDTILAKQFSAGALTPQKVATKIRHPAQIQLGVGYTGIENMTLSADYAWVGWKSFNQLPVNFQGPAPSRVLQEDYNNTSSLRLGAERRFTAGSALRVGFTAATSAAPPETVTPLLPEMDRQLAMIGGFLPLMGGLGLDATYAHIFTPGSRGRIDERPAGSTVAQALALNSGAYTLNANIVSLSLKYSF
jgi:long-chain fatty acid transport protein